MTMRIPYVLLACLLASCAAPKPSEIEFPHDIQLFVERREICDHFRGEAQNGSTSNNGTRTLWQVVEQLAGKMPLTPGAVEQDLGTSLAIKAQTGHVTQWVGGGPIALHDDVHISGISLALGPDSEFSEHSGLSMELGGACIKLDQVRQQFGELKVTQTPRGHSGNETTVHVSSQQGGRISFAFKASKPACLFRVGIRPGQTD